MTFVASKSSGILLGIAFFMAACSSAQISPTSTPLPPASNTPSPSVTPLPPTATPMPTATATPYPLFWDDFSGELQPGWSWIRENDALWSLTSQPGFLRIVLDSAGRSRNLLVRSVASENFQITTHVLFTPTTNFQAAGITVYQDDAIMVNLIRAYCNTANVCVGNGAYFDRIENGGFTSSNFGTDTKLKDEAYLRIDKEGSVFTAYYSDDGDNWQTIGQHELFMTDPEVGLITGGSHIVGAIALFDYFGLQEMP